MRGLILSTLVAAALVAAAPAYGQRASLADRVSLLEQQAAANQGNMDLLNQLTQLRGEVQALRSQLEELQQQNEQLKSTSRAQYLDIDGRLNRLESGAGGAGATLPDPPQASTDAPAGNAGGVLPAPPPRNAPAARAAAPADERAAYEGAFDALRSGRYADAANLFQDFLGQYPDGAYAANALYWLGESYYATQNYELAQQQFQALIGRFPQSDKAPGALLKVGLSQYGLRDLDAAEATLADVGKRYPGTDAARTADDRLRAIRVSRLR
ncbi:tol-pal system protein YbgF [Lysobacteraceae bacterium NML91-0213]|nr:tol-pal system protein YbgF [Xanthomonadaceae bacterium NML91-0213]